MFVYDDVTQKIVEKETTFTPGFYKIFDEIIVNAADNKQRNADMSEMHIDIKPEDNFVSVKNNGKGIPVKMHKDENCYVPTLIFGHLLTGSNFSDEEKKSRLHSFRFRLSLPCRMYSRCLCFCLGFLLTVTFMLSLDSQQLEDETDMVQSCAMPSVKYLSSSVLTQTKD